MDSLNSVLRVTNANGRFLGTCFGIWENENTTWLVTCAHVIRAVGGIDGCRVKGQKVYSVLLGDPDGPFNLAVVKTDRLHIPVLRPAPMAKPGKKVYVCCFRDLQRTNSLAKHQSPAVVDSLASNMSQTGDESVRAYFVEMKNKEFPLESAHSGSPVIDRGTGLVIAVATQNFGEGINGNAICISALGEGWEDVPGPDVFDPERRFFETPKLRMVKWWSDRRRQTKELKAAIKAHQAKKPERPFLCFIHGREKDSPKNFFDRIKDDIFVELFGDRSTLKHFQLSWSHSDPDSNLDDRFALLKTHLADEICDEDEADYDMLRDSMRGRINLILYTLHAATWRKEHQLLDKWFSFWASFPDLNPPPYLFFVVTYGDENVASVNQEIRNYIAPPNAQRKKPPEPHTWSDEDTGYHGVTLLRLNTVLKKDADRWATEVAARFCDLDALLEKIERLFEKVNEWPMDPLADELERIMGETRREVDDD